MTVHAPVPVPVAPGPTPTSEWNEPVGINARGTIIVLGGRGETSGIYARFGTRVAADGYKVRVVGDVTTDVERTTETIAALIADDSLPSPKVLVGSDAGAALAAEIASRPGTALAAVVLAGIPVGEPSPAASWDSEVVLRTSCPAHQSALSRDSAVRAGALFEPIPASLAAVLASGVTVPVLAIHGDADPVSPVAAALDFYLALPNAEIVTIVGGKHDILNDVTHRTVAATVVLFLERSKLGADIPLIARRR